MGHHFEHPIFRAVAKAAGNAALACGYEGSAFQAVFWLGQKSAGNATLACGYEGSAFQAVYNTLTFSPNGLDFRNRRRA
ncbi:MAG: hypothetical protein LBG92_12220 [Prevotellaceae bacterium]|nr:hypothetical protein [Prevotellaceae bacterium]